MRIAHVSDCYFPRLGGIERQVRDLATRQIALGHDVEIITSVPQPGNRDTDEFPVHRPAGARSGNPSAISYGASVAGRDTALSGTYDVIHLHASTWSPLTYLTAYSATKAGIPTAMTVHSMWSYAAPLFGVADTAVRWTTWPIAWSAVSSAAAQPLQRAIGSTSQVAVLPNGVDAGAWRSGFMPRDPARVVIASVGRLADRKRPRQLLRMLRRARARVPAAIALEAVIVGDGPLRASLQRYLDRHEMANWVRLTGAADHDEIRAIYRDVDFYVAPATLESFGIAALEARCAGLPVVAYSRSGVADFVEHGTEGLLARNDDQLTSMIAELATSPSMRSRIRQHNVSTDPAAGWDDVVGKCGALYSDAEELATRRQAKHRLGRHQQVVL
jgi:glycosyltransferase involved in cell wall biosynthesis